MPPIWGHVVDMETQHIAGMDRQNALDMDIKPDTYFIPNK